MDSRIQRFQSDSESVSKYRNGIQLLKEARVDLVLLELSAVEPINTAHPQGTQMAAAQYHEALGYQKCLADLFSLDTVQTLQGNAPVADYGATQKLVDEGMVSSEEELSTLIGE